MAAATLTPEHELKDLAGDISSIWATASWPSLRRLKVIPTADSIRLEGTVGTFFEKQQAYHWARRVARGVLIEDAIEVLPNRTGRTERRQVWLQHAQTFKA